MAMERVLAGRSSTTGPLGTIVVEFVWPCMPVWLIPKMVKVKISDVINLGTMISRILGSLGPDLCHKSCIAAKVVFGHKEGPFGLEF